MSDTIFRLQRTSDFTTPWQNVNISLHVLHFIQSCCELRRLQEIPLPAPCRKSHCLGPAGNPIAWALQRKRERERERDDIEVVHRNAAVGSVVVVTVSRASDLSVLSSAHGRVFARYCFVSVLVPRQTASRFRHVVSFFVTVGRFLSVSLASQITASRVSHVWHVACFVAVGRFLNLLLVSAVTHVSHVWHVAACCVVVIFFARQFAACCRLIAIAGFSAVIQFWNHFQALIVWNAVARYLSIMTHLQLVQFRAAVAH